MALNLAGIKSDEQRIAVVQFGEDCGGRNGRGSPRVENDKT